MITLLMKIEKSSRNEYPVRAFKNKEEAFKTAVELNKLAEAAKLEIRFYTFSMVIE